MEPSSKIGLPPGSLVYTGKHHAAEVVIQALHFNKANVEETNLIEKPRTRAKLWLDINGVHDTEILEQLGQRYDLHPLTLEDMANPNQRPKLEVFEDYLFLELNLIDYDKQTEKLYKEQIAIVLGKNFVITLQESRRDIFSVLKERLKVRDKDLRENGVDYLAYRIIDSVVDHYFLILDEIQEDSENIEEKMFEKFSRDVISDIYNLKKNILTLRKYTRPLTEAIRSFAEIKSPFLKQKTQVFSRDILDHLLRISDHIEHLSGLASEMIDLYQSHAGNRMNEIMKTLTLVGAIFIPLTFFTGLYGMNFKYMPELNWPWSYPALLASFAVLSAGMLLYFRRKKWF